MLGYRNGIEGQGGLSLIIQMTRGFPRLGLPGHSWYRFVKTVIGLSWCHFNCL